jgi:hypothetical protein
MRPEAIHQARERLRKAESAHARLLGARNLDGIESAWGDFLLAANSIYSKLEAGAKGGGPSDGWFGRMTHERRNDELLSYIHHARNTEEHGLAATTVREPGGIAINGDVIISGGIGPGQRLDVTGIPGGRPPSIQIRNPSVKLVPVLDRYRKVFQVPTKHLGAVLDDCSPRNVAGLALNYLRVLIDAGAKYIPPLQ